MKIKSQKKTLEIKKTFSFVPKCKFEMTKNIKRLKNRQNEMTAVMIKIIINMKFSTFISILLICARKLISSKFFLPEMNIRRYYYSGCDLYKILPRTLVLVSTLT